MSTLIRELETRDLELVSIGVASLLEGYGIAVETHPTGRGYLGDGTVDPVKQRWAPRWAVAILVAAPYMTRAHYFTIGKADAEFAKAVSSAYALDYSNGVKELLAMYPEAT